ncbi:MAG: heme exporter protein CcmB [Alphaproteobacteria bacterium]|nr:heme exporter protein CcmB [Alphaproteobacteria bacterium]
MSAALRACRALIARDVRLALRHGAETLAALLFFILVATLFAFGVGPGPETLARIAAGVVFVTALLSAMLSLDRLFAADFEDGTLEQLLLSGLAAELLALAKIAAHWLIAGLPVVLVAPLMAVMLQLPGPAYPAMIAALLLATPLLSLLGGVGAALTLGARRGGILVPLLVLPLAVPVLIFAVGATEAAAMGLSPRPHLLFLAAMLVAALPLAPVAIAASLRAAAE